MIGTVYAVIAVLIPSTYPLIAAGMICTRYIKCHKMNYSQELIFDICTENEMECYVTSEQFFVLIRSTVSHRSQILISS
jgi:hypothetical protein